MFFVCFFFFFFFVPFLIDSEDEHATRRRGLEGDGEKKRVYKKRGKKKKCARGDSVEKGENFRITFVGAPDWKNRTAMPAFHEQRLAFTTCRHNHDGTLVDQHMDEKKRAS